MTPLAPSSGTACPASQEQETGLGQGIWSQQQKKTLLNENHHEQMELEADAGRN